MKRLLTTIIFVFLASTASLSLQARERVLHVVTTGDVHGSWFSKTYVDGSAKNSLMAVMHYVDSLRSSVGEDNVLLLDAGDCLQGDNAAYYFNYVDTLYPHLFPRIVDYMGYDAIAVGNHDIETGHPVYDRVDAELAARGIPWLGGNAIKTNNAITGSNDSYFPTCKMFRRAGLKVAVLGFTNPNMKAWLSEPLWSGIEFVPLIPFVQQKLDEVVAAHKPDVVIVVAHSGIGKGDGSILEDQGLDLLNSLHGVDLVISGHDHRPMVVRNGDAVLIDGGSRASEVGHATIRADKRLGRLRSKTVDAEEVRMNRNLVDKQMEVHFAEDFDKVRAFTMQHVGNLAMTIHTRDAFTGMSDYINMLHTVQLGVSQAQISFAAPLSSNGTIKAGELIYNDMFTLYSYENQLFVVKMRGSEIKRYLEYSYDCWIQQPGEHVLKIDKRPDARSGSSRWSFRNAFYNFDSAGGLVYNVDITKPAGQRVSIALLADGTPFDEAAWYNVAMTSYRANGGGDLMIKGAGLSKEEIDSRIVARYPEIREMIYRFIRTHDTVDSALVGDKSVIGEWHFVPEGLASGMIEKDMKLIF